MATYYALLQDGTTVIEKQSLQSILLTRQPIRYLFEEVEASSHPTYNMWTKTLYSHSIIDKDGQLNKVELERYIIEGIGIDDKQSTGTNRKVYIRDKESDVLMTINTYTHEWWFGTFLSETLPALINELNLLASFKVFNVMTEYSILIKENQELQKQLEVERS